MTSSFERILVSQDAGSGIGRITLNRPEKRNALDGLVITELKTALEELRGSRVILLAAAGKDFCSGADLAALEQVRANGVMENLDDARALADLFLLMRRYPRPIVAAVRGRALAGGCGLATACDLVLASATAQFGYPEVNIGFVPAMVMALLRRNVSEKQAFEWITMGEILSAQMAQACGLINRVFADAAMDAEVEAFAASLAAKSASALSLCKSLLYHMDGAGFEAALEAGVQMNGIARMTEDCRAGIDRFLRRT